MIVRSLMNSQRSAGAPIGPSAGAKMPEQHGWTLGVILDPLMRHGPPGSRAVIRQTGLPQRAPIAARSCPVRFHWKAVAAVGVSAERGLVVLGTRPNRLGTPRIMARGFRNQRRSLPDRSGPDSAAEGESSAKRACGQLPLSRFRLQSGLVVLGTRWPLSATWF